MTAHHFYSPSKAAQWVECPASMTFPENQPQEERQSNKYADDGTATHEWAAFCIKNNLAPDELLGAIQKIAGAQYVMDEDRAERISRYIEWAHIICGGKPMFVEHRVSMKPYVDTEGTCDIGHVFTGKWGDEVIALDLKDGSGERVSPKHNYQGLLYVIGLVSDAKLMGYKPVGVRIGIGQPKLNSFEVWPPIDEPPYAIGDLMVFAGKAARAIDMAEGMMVGKWPLEYAPGDKTCRWCGIKAKCPALRAKMEAVIGAEFDEIIVGGALPPPHEAKLLSEAYATIPLIEGWIKAVRSSILTRVGAGEKIEGTDGKPLKFVEGKKGDRKWIDEKAAEEMLCAQIGPDKAYKPSKVISAAEAAKLLDKKKTAATWAMFADNISRAPGRPVLVLGSDDRPEFTGGVASADDFNDIEE